MVIFFFIQNSIKTLFDFQAISFKYIDFFCKYYNIYGFYKIVKKKFNH